MATKTKKQETQAKEFNLQRVCTLWIYSTKDKKGKYLSGRADAGEKIIGFFNSKDRQNPKEPDIRLEFKNAPGEEKKTYGSLWCNASKNGNKYLSGKVEGKRVVGFFNSKAQVDGIIPYINIYLSEDKPTDETITAEKKEEPKFEEIEDGMELPF